MIDNLWPDPYEPIPAPLPSRQEQTSHSEGRLLHRSDFSVPSDDWDEIESDKVKSFRQNGYFHIVIKRPSSGQSFHPTLPVTDIRVLVDAEFIKNSGETALCGVEFRL